MLTREEAIVYECYKNDYEAAMLNLIGGNVVFKEVSKEINGETITVKKKDVSAIFKKLIKEKYLYKDITVEALLAKRGELIKYIENPSSEYQVIAVSNMPSAVRLISNLSEDAKDAVLRDVAKTHNLWADEAWINEMDDDTLLYYLDINPDLGTLIKKERWNSELVTAYLRKMVTDNRGELIDDYQRRIKIPDQYRDKTFYRSYCMVDGYNYSKIPKDKREEYIMEKLIYYTLEHAASFVGTLWMFQYLPDKFKTEDICLKCCVKHFACIEYLPDRFKNNEFYLSLMELGQYRFLDDLDFSTASEEVILAALNKGYNNGSLPPIPSKLYTEKIAMACSKCSRALEYKIPSKYLTKEWYESYAANTGCLSNVPTKYITLDMCISAMKKNSLAAFKGIPEKFKTAEFWKKIIDALAFSSINDVPEEYRTEELYFRYATEKRYGAFKDVPEEYRTDKLFMSVLNKNPNLAVDVLRLSPSEKVKEYITRFIMDKSSLKDYERFYIALYLDNVPSKFIDEFIEKRRDTVLLRGISEEQIKRSIELFPENVLYAPNIVCEDDIKEENEENAVTVTEIPVQTESLVISDASVFTQMSIWDILSA